MDPRIKAIHDTQKGIPNDDQWNEGQPMSKADKERDANVQIYFTIVLIVFTAATFGQGFVLAKWSNIYYRNFQIFSNLT